jgi:hypothetical protein
LSNDVKGRKPVFSLLLSSRLRAFTVALALLLTGSSAGAQKSPSPRVPAFVYGAWEIYDYVEVGGHAGETKERAKNQMGKTLTMGFKSFDHDRDLLWFGSDSCKSVRYKMKVNNEDDADKGSLGFYRLEQAKSDGDEFIIVSCSKQEICELELTKNQELAVYYDGWFFFLRKTNGASG